MTFRIAVVVMWGAVSLTIASMMGCALFEQHACHVARSAADVICVVLPSGETVQLTPGEVAAYAAARRAAAARVAGDAGLARDAQ